MNQQRDNKLIVSIDLDMWWHCRWATGSATSLWPDTKSLFVDYYGQKEPGRELVSYTDNVLKILDKHGIKATFFVLGEVASYFPNLIKTIYAAGHEIACHGWFHVDAFELGRQEFCEQVKKSKLFLEDLIGESVKGYRAPNLILTPWIFEEIVNLGFLYDSSICPSRSFFGKYADYVDVSNNPFTIPVHSGGNVQNLVEIPIPTMPMLKLPACSGIITRILGAWWSRLALKITLQGGDAMYYFHPYEIGDRPHLDHETIYMKLFLRNLGGNYLQMLDSIFSSVGCKDTILAREVVSPKIVNLEGV